MNGWKALLTACVLALGLVVSGCGGDGPGSSAGRVSIGTKNFSEQFVLGELMAQLIEDRTDLKVERRFNLGGTMICHGALENGEIDLYAEYTGTALTAILEREVIRDPEQAYGVVARAYRERFGADWLEPFGFNNTYAITVEREVAERRGWTRVSDLAPLAGELKAGFTAEFAERPDGYRGLREAYGFEFGDVRDMDPGLMYSAIDEGQVDVVCAFATDGRIEAFDLKPLEDDRGFFPPYYAAPVVRSETLEAHPELAAALAPLAGRLDNRDMQRLNFEVDGKGRDPKDVARQYLQAEGLIGSDDTERTGG